MKTLKYLAIPILAGFMLIVASCDKEDEKITSTTSLSVKMSNTDAKKSLQGDDKTNLFDEVNVEVQSVLIHYGDTAENGSWMELPTNAGMYDLLALDSTSVVLANGTAFPAGFISQMRLVLGNDNYVMIDSVAYDLKTPSAQQSGLKLNLGLQAEPGKEYEILLDFNAAESIVLQGNGGFLLKPVLRIESIVEVGP